MDEKSLSAKHVFGFYAKAYADKYWQQPFFDPLLRRFTRNQLFGSEILDLGCGPGNLTSILLSRRDDLRVEGWDFAPEMISEAEIRVPQAQFCVRDVMEIKDISKKYDGILCAFCAPYLSPSNLQIFLQEVKRNLKEKGLFYFSTMIAQETKEFWMPPKDDAGSELYVHIHCESVLREIFKELGFEVIDELKVELEGDAGEEDWAVIFQKV